VIGISDKHPLVYKQAVIIRTDIGMSVGKSIAQAGHVIRGSAEIARQQTPDVWQAWIDEGEAKIVLAVNSLDTLERLEQKAIERNIPCCIIADLGRTELPSGTITALAIGPALTTAINPVTRELKRL